MADDYVQQCAAQLFGAIDLIMHTIGPEAKKRAPTELSMHQFRAMMTIKRHDGASLSEMAEHLGATVSSASKIVEALVERGLIARATDADDRRKLALALTDEGEALMASAHLRLLTVLAEKLSSLSPNECAMVELAMGIVRSALAQARTTSSEE